VAVDGSRWSGRNSPLARTVAPNRREHGVLLCWLGAILVAAGDGGDVGVLVVVGGRRSSRKTLKIEQRNRQGSMGVDWESG